MHILQSTHLGWQGPDRQINLPFQNFSLQFERAEHFQVDMHLGILRAEVPKQIDYIHLLVSKHRIQYSNGYGSSQFTFQLDNVVLEIIDLAN
ncbi:hypothetical protein D9M71_700200 [compost metagenome]